MSNKHDKLIEKLTQGRKPRDIKFSEVESLVKSFGGKVEQDGTSHTALFIGTEKETMQKPHGRGENTLKQYQIKALVNFLKRAGKI